MRIIGMFVGMVMFLAVVFAAAPFVLGIFAITVASRSPEARRSMELAQKYNEDLDAARMRAAIAKLPENAKRDLHGDEMLRDGYAGRGEGFAASRSRPAPEPGQPMLDPAPLR